uniref:Uncharacterized protein n=1 Tax=Amphimedon queenslandica TaxID=400682 RepID=A0A1X7TMA3_AMPQE
MIRNTPWSAEDCNSGADCFYLNYSAIPSYSRESPPGIPIENCTLENDYDEKDVTCYIIGFHPAVGIALLGGFINIVTPLLFAFYVSIQVKIFWKVYKKFRDDKIKGKFKYWCRFRILRIVLCYVLFVFIISSLPMAFVALVYFNYETPRDRQNSFEKLFSSESFLGQSIAFCFASSAFLVFPVMHIEKYSIDTTENNNINEDDDDYYYGENENRNETVNFARDAPRRGSSGQGALRPSRSYGTS